ncbi:MAG: helix-turn-helix domain-containing protein [Dehalococcoidia bacterium]|nr:helix-turn-helix domain-containing protein [Dehalococcoidia bacterium]
MRNWGFLTNHAHVLIQVARNPRSTVREIALATGITERAAISALHDIRRAGIASARREGRQNVHRVDMGALLRHRPWATSGMAIPESLVLATLRGLGDVGGVDPASIAPAPRRPPSSDGQDLRGTARRWGFLTNHALILIHVTQHPRSTVREIALAVGITERAAHAALQDLRETGIVDRQREGRRNSYTVNFEHLAAFRREGAAPDLVPGAFVSSLVQGLLELRPRG